MIECGHGDLPQADVEVLVNTVNCVGVREDGPWRIVLLQTMPAQFHGRPDSVRHLTDELQQTLQGEGQ